MRVKSYLATHGVEFDAINIQEDPVGAAELEARDIKGLPVIAKGDCYVVGLDLSRVDELLGFEEGASSALLPVADLVARAARLLYLALGYAAQLPLCHHDDPIPGMENVKIPLILPDGTALILPDGTPYVPHRTNIALVRHIVAHGIKVRYVAENPAADLSDIGAFTALGESAENATIDELTAAAAAAGQAITAWFARTGGRGVETIMRTFYGDQSVHQVLQSHVYSLTQHSRQLMTVLIDLQIVPAERLGPEDYEGLLLPTGVWS